MIINKIKNIVDNLKVMFRDEHALFRVSMGLKFALIPTLSLMFAILLNYIILRVTISTLMSFENVRDFVIVDILYLFIEKSVVDIIPWFILLFWILLILGMFLANVVIRPFKIIGDYCEQKVKGQTVSYDPEFVTNLKLLSSFSEWFFSTIDVMKEVGDIREVKIPEKYKRIHQPVFETSFFLYTSLVVTIATALTAILTLYANYEVFNGVVEVVREFFVNKAELKTFLVKLNEVYSLISIFIVAFNIIAYLFFCIYLYSKISTPAFGFFATMRSFISGRHSNRVHLIGYPFVRKYTRSLNKYLDELERSALESNKNAKDN
ncbi:hypothetical protein [Bacteriovorax sp. Seq25_V]|uniref:hypothetical protein n=1 Tax=Bacteriovorax sp. Seq25_V TaxID=1201288 RepID=UPI000389FDA8|nr:hypothetical protein [Bacteriovorax sp. Seq25_V]EQC47300.1 hypothetical protein M900_0671 [Bacteriovorax sp. Seq25_V]